MVDVTPLVPHDRQVIESYSVQGFRVSGVFYDGAIIILPQETHRWAVTAMDQMSLDNLAPILGADVEILLLGCGRRMERVPSALRQELRRHGVVIDAMDTGAACRTYSILLAEERRVGAALLPAGKTATS